MEAGSTENKGIEFEKNSFYVQVLAPGEAITLEQMITITENCDPGQAVITFSLDYEDLKATATTSTELLSFQIIQPVRVKLEASDIPSVLYTMDTVEIPVKAMNLGRDKIYNAIKFDSEIKETQIKSLKVEDDQEKTNNWWYSIAAVVAVLLISIILILVRKLHKKNILLEEVRKADSH